MRIIWLEGRNPSAHLLLFSNQTLEFKMNGALSVDDILQILGDSGERSVCTTPQCVRENKPSLFSLFQECHNNGLSVIRANL